MRMLLATIFVLATTACMGNEAEPTAPAELREATSEAASELQAGGPEAPEAPDASGQAAITAGCAHVVFCDAPGSIGTVCQQDGCSLGAAKSECYRDVASLGCSFHCPGRIQLPGGGFSTMCCPGVCAPGCPC